MTTETVGAIVVILTVVVVVWAIGYSWWSLRQHRPRDARTEPSRTINVVISADTSEFEAALAKTHQAVGDVVGRVAERRGFDLSFATADGRKAYCCSRCGAIWSLDDDHLPDCDNRPQAQDGNP